MRKKSRITLWRELLKLTQEQMAALLNTVQSEISITENSGKIEEADIPHWALRYGVSADEFRNECAKLQRAHKRKRPVWHGMELWSYFVNTPLQVQGIRCVPQKQPESVLTPEYTAELLARSNVDETTLNLAIAKMRLRRRLA